MAESARELIIEKLSSYFSSRSDIAFAFLFGSFAGETTGNHSDIDVAVYFYSKSGELEIEDDVYYEGEDEIWEYIDNTAERETDLLVINRAPARVSYTALSEGLVLKINDRALYLRVLLATGRLFEEYGEFTRSFLEIKARSSSLSPSDRDRLVRIIDFLETEIDDVKTFTSLSYEEYMKDSGKRRNVERWIENCVNASIDMAKILIASEKIHIPQTYRETIARLKMFKEFSPTLNDSLAKNTRLRNLLAHEYLDIRFPHIIDFIGTSEKNYRNYIREMRNYISGLDPVH